MDDDSLFIDEGASHKCKYCTLKIPLNRDCCHICALIIEKQEENVFNDFIVKNDFADKHEARKIIEKFKKFLTDNHMYIRKTHDKAPHNFDISNYLC